MSNSTRKGDGGWSFVPSYIVYTVEGFLFGGSNLIIVAAVLRYVALRRTKEYLIMMSLSLADTINMLGYILAGFRRIYLILTNQYHTLMTPWQCITTSHNLVWLFGEHVAGTMLLAVSADRLLAVTRPLKYIKWSSNYALALVGTVYGYTFLSAFVTALVFMYNGREEAEENDVMMQANCYAGGYGMVGAYAPYVTYYKFATPVFSSLSVVVYGFVWIAYKRSQQRMVGDISNPQEKSRLARQRRVTVTLGISCMCTIFFYIIPYSLGYYLAGKVDDNITMVMWLMANVNAFCNFFIYAMRHKEMKEAIAALFSCKSMPDNLDVWKANKLASHSSKLRKVQSSGKAGQGQENNGQEDLVEIG